MQDHYGYIWITTYDGIIRFDGNRFVTFNNTNTPEFKTNRFILSFISDDGTIWFISSLNELFYFDGNQFNGIQTNLNITYIYQTENKSLIITTNDGIYKIIDYSLIRLYPEISGEIESLLTLSDILFYKKNKKDLYAYKNGKSELVLTAKGMVQNQLKSINRRGVTYFIFGTTTVTYRDKNIEFIHLDETFETRFSDILLYEGDIFLPGINMGVFKLELTELNNNNPYSLIVEHPPIDQKSLAVDNLGNILYFSENGFYINFNDFTAVKGKITSTLIDASNSIWLTTHSQGLLSYSENPFTTLFPTGNPENSNIFSLNLLTNGSVLTGIFGNGFYLINKDYTTTHLTNKLSPDSKLSYSAAELSNGSLLLGYHTDGVFEYTTTGEWYQVESHSENYTIPTAIYIENDTLIWIGAQNRLTIHSYEPHNSPRFPILKSFHDLDVRDIIKTPDDKIWLATYNNGIIRLDSTRTPFDTLSYVRDKHRDFRSLTLDPNIKNNTNYSVWGTTETSGIIRFDCIESNCSETLFNTNNGLPENLIHRVIFDNNNNNNRRVWATTNRGLLLLYYDDLSAFNKSRHDLFYTIFDHHHGLKSREFNGASMNSGFKHHDGSIWLPSQQGIVIVKPHLISDHNKADNVLFESINFNDSVTGLLGKTEFTLPHSVRMFSIRFTDLDFRKSTPDIYFYRFNDESKWQILNTRKELFFTNIKPGKHQIELINFNKDQTSKVNSSSALTLIVPHYFYETTWFYLLIFLHSLILLVLFIKYRVKNSEKRAILMERMVEDRT